MEDLLRWMPSVIGLVALIIALIVARRQGGDVHLEGVLDDATDYLEQGAEVLTEGAEFIQEIAPAAKELVKGARQYYVNGELELDELKPLVMQQMRELFPRASEKRLDMAVEAAVFAAKLVAKEAWKRLPKDEEATDAVDTLPAVGTLEHVAP